MSGAVNVQRASLLTRLLGVDFNCLNYYNQPPDLQVKV